MLESNDDVQAEVVEQLKPFMPRMTLEYLRDLPLADLLRHIERLPADSLILYARQTMRTPTAGMAQGGGAQKRRPRFPGSGLRGLRSARRAWRRWWIRHGGRGFCAARCRHRAPRRNRDARADIPNQAGPIRPMFDWRQLDKFGVTLDKLPAGSDVRFREYTFWEQNQSVRDRGARRVPRAELLDRRPVDSARQPPPGGAGAARQ